MSFLFGFFWGFVATALVVLPTGFFDDANWASVMVAVAALGVAAYETHQSREQVRRAHRPHCALIMNIDKNAAKVQTFTISVQNAGPGVAQVKTLSAEAKGEVVTIRKPNDWAKVFALLGEPLPPVARAIGVQRDGLFVPPDAAKPESIIGPVTIPPGKQNYLAGLTLRVEIWSLLGERMPDSTVTFGPSDSP